MLRVNEMIAVVIIDKPFDSPVVINPVRIEKLYAPPLTRRRETAQKEHTGSFGEKGFQGMMDNGQCQGLTLNTKH